VHAVGEQRQRTKDHATNEFDPEKGRVGSERDQQGSAAEILSDA
jgi:hypothetical protein